MFTNASAALLLSASVALAACGRQVSPMAPDPVNQPTPGAQGLSTTRLAPAYVAQVWEPPGAICRATETPSFWTCRFVVYVGNIVNLDWYDTAPNLTWVAACAADVHGSLTYTDAPGVTTDWALPRDRLLRIGDPPSAIVIDQRLPTGTFPWSVFAHPQWASVPCP